MKARLAGRHPKTPSILLPPPTPFNTNSSAARWVIKVYKAKTEAAKRILLAAKREDVTPSRKRQHPDAGGGFERKKES